MREAGQEQYLPLGLLSRAGYYRWCLAFDIQQAVGPAATAALPLAQQHALQDLQESHDIAQRGGMCLHLTDYHLESARLALTVCFHPYDGSLPSSERELKQQAVEHIE